MSRHRCVRNDVPVCDARWTVLHHASRRNTSPWPARVHTPNVVFVMSP